MKQQEQQQQSTQAAVASVEQPKTKVIVKRGVIKKG